VIDVSRKPLSECILKVAHRYSSAVTISSNTKFACAVLQSMSRTNSTN